MKKQIISGIYQIKNIINDKIYIGSSKDIYKRWRYHKSNLKLGKHCNKHLQSAWNTYGEENFEFSILEIVNSLKELYLIEQKYIDKLHPFDDNGYNLCKTTNSYHFGYKMPDGTIKKLTGRAFTEEHKRNLSLSSPKKKQVMQFSLDGHFIKLWDCTRDIVEYYNLDNARTIIYCCEENNRHLSANGFIWMYPELYSVKALQDRVNHQRFSNKRKIVQVTQQGKYVTTWDNIVAISKYYNISGENISDCCKGIRKCSCKFRWIYLEDYNIHKNDLVNFINTLYQPKVRIYKKVVQVDMNYNFITIWKDSREIEKTLGFKSSYIVSCCNGKINSTYGFRWIYEKDYNTDNYNKTKLNGNAKPVIQIELDGTFIKEWVSVTDIQNEINFPSSSIKSTCNGHKKSHKYKNYLWYYKEDYDNLKNKLIKDVIIYEESHRYKYPA